MANDSYIRDPRTGLEITTIDGDFRLTGSLEVVGTLTNHGQAVGGGSISLETPSGTVNGSNRDFTFSSPPIAVFRNGVQETRLGAIVGSVFTFATPPETGDDIEGLI